MKKNQEFNNVALNKMPSNNELPKTWKKGLTLPEILFAVLVITVIMSLLLPNIINSKDRAIISSTVTNDAKLLAQAFTEWKGNSSYSNGTYANIETGMLTSFLPETMSVDDGGTPNDFSDDIIKSSGLNGGISYQVFSDEITTSGDSLKIIANGQVARDSQNWSERVSDSFEDTVANAFIGLSIDKNNAKLGKTSLATALGSANASFTLGGVSGDTTIGIRFIKF